MSTYQDERLHIWSLARQADVTNRFDTYEIEYFDTMRLRLVLATSGRGVSIRIPLLLKGAPDDAMVAAIEYAYNMRTNNDPRFDDRMIDYLLSRSFLSKARARCKKVALYDFTGSKQFKSQVHRRVVDTYLPEFKEILGSVLVKYRAPGYDSGTQIHIASSILAKLIILDPRYDALQVNVRRYVIYHEMCVIASYDYRHMMVDRFKFERLLKRFPDTLKWERECVRAGVVFKVNTDAQFTSGAAHVSKHRECRSGRQALRKGPWEDILLERRQAFEERGPGDIHEDV